MPANEVPVPLSRGGTRKLLAHWLRSEIGEGGVFTIEDAEKMVQAATGLKRVEVDRRVRELREVRWVIANSRTDPTLLPNQHRLVHVGDDITHHLFRWPQGRRCSAAVRRAVFMRDGRVCVVCGIEAGQAYPEAPGMIARLTIGRILPGSKGGAYSPGNCQVECARCNEAVQDRYDYGGDLSEAA
jgi:hypothetical protein